MFLTGSCSVVSELTNEFDKNTIEKQNIQQCIDGRIIVNYDIFRYFFNKNEQEIPINKFLTYYFDWRYLNVFKHKEIVEYQAIHISHAPFHGIDGEYFGAYWVGYIDFKENTTINVKYDDVQQIIIDGVIQLNNKNLSKNIPINFSEGRHKVEVFFLSRYRFPSFLVTYNVERKADDVELIKNRLSSIKNSVVWYCGVHSSESHDFSIDLKLKESKDPVILFLASENPVIWNLNYFDKTNIQAIVISSNSTGSVLRIAPPAAKIMYFDKVPIQHNLSNNVTNFIISIEYLTGKKPSGFSGSMISKSFIVPGYEFNHSESTLSRINYNRASEIQKSINLTNCNEKYDDDYSKKICTLSVLQYTDDRLNSCYQELKNLLDPAYGKFWERKREVREGELKWLITSQRLWIKARNARCGIDNKIQQKESWLDYVAKSTDLSSCILEETEKRIAKLEEMKLDIKKPIQQPAD